jgi:hypothetical protein
VDEELDGGFSEFVDGVGWPLANKSGISSSSFVVFVGDNEALSLRSNSAKMLK